MSAATGIRITENEECPIGTIRVIPGAITESDPTLAIPELAYTAPRLIEMHPLDAIALRCGKDLHARTDQAMQWILDRAHRKLDAIDARIEASREVIPEPAPEPPRGYFRRVEIFGEIGFEFVSDDDREEFYRQVAEVIEGKR